MPSVTLSIKHWGNGLGVRLPASIAKAAHLLADMEVKIMVEKGCEAIKPLKGKPLSFELRLELFALEQHGGVAMETNEWQGVESRECEKINRYEIGWYVV